MNIRDNTDEAFLADVEQWLDASLARMRARFAPHEWVHAECRTAWNAELCAANLVALDWPRELGGRNLSTAALIKFHEMCAVRRAPQPLNSIAHSILAPTLLKFGTEEQKRRFLEGIRLGTEVWCQGYSEPGSGSDLASVKTRASREGDGWVVTGHKVWTTQAHAARWCFALVRTDPDSRAHKGLSFMLVDLKAEGARVEPIRQITGEADYNEVFLEQVQVPDGNLVGAPGDGWRIAMAAAEYERGIYFLPRVIQLEAELQDVEALFGRAASAEPARTRLAAALATLSDTCFVIRCRVDAILRRVATGSTPGTDGAVLKLLWSETRQALQETRMELLGEAAMLGPDSGARFSEAAVATREFLWSRAETIVAGTSEVQRNIIAERVLGLPKG